MNKIILSIIILIVISFISSYIYIIIKEKNIIKYYKEYNNNNNKNNNNNNNNIDHILENIKKYKCPVTKNKYIILSLLNSLFICILFGLYNYITNKNNINLIHYVILFLILYIIIYYSIIYNNYIYIESLCNNINKEIIDIENIFIIKNKKVNNNNIYI
jgi:hypothetical protein